MARPPEHKPLLAKHHVLTWTSVAGHKRGLYAEARGRFVQARITGYGMHPNEIIAHCWADLAFRVDMLTLHWGRIWQPMGQKLKNLIERHGLQHAAGQGA